MKDMSNSTLALLVVLTLVVSVFGTLFSMSQLDTISTTKLVGFASTNVSAMGTVNLTVPSTAYINLTDALIEFGSLEPLNTNTSDDIDDWFRVRNDGADNISIDIYDDNQYTGTAGSGPFDSGTTTAGCLNTAPRTCFMVKCNSTQSGYFCNNTYYAMPTGSGTTFLIDLETAASTDEAVFGINVTVPQDELSGNKETQTIYFLASSSN